MKNSIFLLSTFLLSFQLFAQENISLESEIMDARFFETDKIPIVKGKLKNYSPEADKDLIIKYILVTIESRQVELFADINTKGEFELKFPHPFAYQQAWLFIGDYYYGQIIAHEDLLIEADLKKLKKKNIYFYGKGIQFKGKDGELNTYFNKFVNFKEKEKQKYYKTYQTILMDRQLSSEDKRSKYIESHQTWDKILADYIQLYPSRYSSLLKNESDADFYGKLFLTYIQQGIQDELLKKGLMHQPLMVSNNGISYYKYLTYLLKRLSPEANIAFVRKTLLDKIYSEDNYQKFDLFLKQYQLRLERKSYDKGIFAEGDSLFLNPHKDFFKLAKMDYFKEKVEHYGQRKADILKLCGAPEDKWEQQVYYEKMLPSIQTKWVKSLMQQTLKNAIAYTKEVDRTLQKANTLTESSSLGKGLDSFPFGAKLYKAEAEDAATLLASIQNAFPNKSIILDVWATWCGPCIYDMKNSRETKKALKELPVEVIYLCVEDGSSQKKWTKTVAELKTEGNHIFLEKELAKSVMKFFELKGYPSHIFIDRKGNWDTNFIHSLAHLDIHKLKKKL